ESFAWSGWGGCVSYGERYEPVFFCLVVDRQPQLVAPLVEHRRTEGQDERRIDGCPGPEARGAARLELSFRTHALAVWNRHSLAVGVEQLQPELVLRVRLVPRNLEEGSDEEAERALRVHHRPASADDVQLSVRHPREVGDHESHLHDPGSFAGRR